MTRVRFAPLAITFILLGTVTSAAAHDPKGITVQELNSASPQIQAALQATTVADGATRSVLNNLRLWPVPRRLTVCFLSGSPVLRKRVADSMQRVWHLQALTQGRLAFDVDSFSKLDDCGATVVADIRIAFQAGTGYWSYVGTESRNHTPSMNFQGFTETSPGDSELDRIVGHETGHALGLEHEHQSPGAPECGWKFDYIKAHYQWNSDEEMYSNFVKLTDYIVRNNLHAYAFSTYDKSSLMHYDFPKEAFADGEHSPCFIKTNLAPSFQDESAIMTAYGQDLIATQAATRDISVNVMQKVDKPEVLTNLINLKEKLLQAADH